MIAAATDVPAGQGAHKWAAKAGHAQLRWTEGILGVLSADAEDGVALYTIVPLHVRQDTSRRVTKLAALRME